ncbi:MAG: hypothetical protein J0G32_01485 [Alphaproteobacteria bacterium]|nr:hypothetical protein [Alphaproteobacteria bacterium]OJV13127.1 MAG: hypothetical protein BGO27_02750 [Alphaproteobacteria bacterium 33-17]
MKVNFWLNDFIEPKKPREWRFDPSFNHSEQSLVDVIQYKLKPLQKQKPFIDLIQKYKVEHGQDISEICDKLYRGGLSIDEVKYHVRDL